MSSLGGELQRARKAKGVGLEDAARALGIVEEELGRWESGAVIPRGSQLQRAADVYEADLPNLLRLLAEAIREEVPPDIRLRRGHLIREEREEAARLRSDKLMSSFESLLELFDDLHLDLQALKDDVKEVLRRLDSLDRD